MALCIKSVWSDEIFVYSVSESLFIFLCNRAKDYANIFYTYTFFLKSISRCSLLSVIKGE